MLEKKETLEKRLKVWWLGKKLCGLKKLEVIGLFKVIETLSVCLASLFFANLFYYSAYFYYYLWVPLHFLILFMNSTVLFQFTFTFIYNNFSKKFTVSVK